MDRIQDDVEHPPGESTPPSIPIESELGRFAKMVDGEDGERTDLGNLTKLSEEDIEGILRIRRGLLRLFSKNLDFAVVKTGNNARNISVLVGAVAMITAYKLARRRKSGGE